MPIGQVHVRESETRGSNIIHVWNVTDHRRKLPPLSAVLHCLIQHLAAGYLCSQAFYETLNIYNRHFLSCSWSITRCVRGAMTHKVTF